MICTSIEELSWKIEKIRMGRKIVLATGSFDLFHYDHLKYLEGAKKQGDILVVAVKSDKAVKKKNPERPIICEEHRAAIVDSIKPVDFTIIVDYNEALQLEIDADNAKQREWLIIFQELFKGLRPDILYHEDNPILQSARDKVFEKYGIKGVMKKRGKNASTTEIVEKLKAI